MARFNLDDYATVDQRLALLFTDHPSARIVTTNLTTSQDRAAGVWVMKAELYLVEDGQPFLERQLEPVGARDAIARPIMEVLVRDD